MAKSVNRVTLLGNVGKDPEVKFLPSGQAVANFTIATSDRFKDKAGEWQDRTEWHNLAAFARTAEIVRDYVKKGSKIYVEGRLTTRSWDDKDTGKKVYRTEIMVNELVLLSGRGDGEGGAGGGSYAGSRGASGSSGSTGGYDQRVSAPVQDDYGDTGITDDDIPF
jgi:single-strand DNA-binding protein